MDNNDNKAMPGGCPGAAMRQFDSDQASEGADHNAGPSRLRSWPVQLKLVGPQAPFLQGADLLIAADCVPFAHSNFHEEYLKDKVVVVGCPKLDDLQQYIEKLTQIYRDCNLSSVEVILMEVPCCSGLAHAAKLAKEQAGVDVPLKVTTIGVRGENFGTQPL